MGDEIRQVGFPVSKGERETRQPVRAQGSLRPKKAWLQRLFVGSRERANNLCDAVTLASTAHLVD